MSATSRQQRLVKYAAIAIAAWCMAEPLGAVDESVFGTYSGRLHSEQRAVHVDLEIVKNERYGQGGGAADALLFISTKGESPPSNPIALIGEDTEMFRNRDVVGTTPRHKPEREFRFTAPEASEAFGGSFGVQLTQEGGQLKGTLGLRQCEFGIGETGQQRSRRSRQTSRSCSPDRARPKANRVLLREAEGPKQLNPDEITGAYEGTLTTNKRQFYSELRINKKGLTNCPLC